MLKDTMAPSDVKITCNRDSCYWRARCKL